MGTKAKVAIAVDSTISLPQEMVEEAGLLVVPLDMVFEGVTYRDGELPPAQFYQMLKEAERLPTTSAPKPASFLETFTQASQQAESILCMTLPSSLSATYNVAKVAAAHLRQTRPDLCITVLDSQTAGGALGFLALEAARAARQGASLQEVILRVQALAPRVRLVATLDTLYYLWKGGRVPAVGHWVGSVLNIKPVLELARGEVHIRGVTRTRAKAVHKLLSLLQEASAEGPLHVNVVHTHCPDEAEALREQVAEAAPCSELFVSEFTTAMGVHTGPGLLGLCFYTEGPPS